MNTLKRCIARNQCVHVRMCTFECARSNVHVRMCMFSPVRIPAPSFFHVCIHSCVYTLMCVYTHVCIPDHVSIHDISRWSAKKRLRAYVHADIVVSVEELSFGCNHACTPTSHHPSMSHSMGKYTQSWTCMHASLYTSTLHTSLYCMVRTIPKLPPTIPSRSVRGSPSVLDVTCHPIHVCVYVCMYVCMHVWNTHTHNKRTHVFMFGMPRSSPSQILDCKLVRAYIHIYVNTLSHGMASLFITLLRPSICACMCLCLHVYVSVRYLL